MALCDGPEGAVHVRVAGHEGRIYLDLADPARHVVELDAHGWRVVTNPPVLFRRGRGVLALPVPERGGRLDVLRDLVNVEEEHDWLLLVAWLLSALRPRGPYPVLCLHGQQGAAK